MEYWSDTYRQWMPGVVQRVRDGGQIFDLDVKKGAQACKLRIERRVPFAAGSLGSPVPYEFPPRAGVETIERQGDASGMTKAIQLHEPWSDTAGQDMVSRAGAVTVRKMVETTKALLQGLEGALILRAGFLASCFHMWRAEGTLSRAGRLYQEEFLRHHNEWGAHVDQFRSHYESEMERFQNLLETHKNASGRQQQMVLEKWLLGDRKGLMQSTWHFWHLLAKDAKGSKQRRQKVGLMISQWYEGKAKGARDAGFKAWAACSAEEKRHRSCEKEFGTALASRQMQEEAEQKRKDAEFQAKLNAIQRKHKDGTNNIKAVLAKKFKGEAKGMLIICFEEWKKLKREGKNRENLQMQMRKWAEGGDRGLKHSCFLNWRNLVQDALNSKDADHLRKEHERLESMLTNQAKDMQTEAEKRKKEAEAVVQTILRKWDMGKEKGMVKEVVVLWAKFTAETKIKARAKQAVHDSILRAFEGDAKAAKHMAFLNWKQLTVNEKHVRELEKATGNADSKILKLMQETEARREAELSGVELLKAQAHEATQMMLKKWFLGNEKGLIKTVFSDWCAYIKKKAERDRRHQAVRDSMMRFMEGEKKGIMHSNFASWAGSWREAKASRAGRGEAESRIAQMEKQMKTMMDKHAAGLRKYAEMMGSKQGPVLKNMCFTAWRGLMGGLKQELENERERAVAIEHLERQKHMKEALTKERRDRALLAMGCKRSILVCGVMFEAWAYLWEKTADERASKMEHNKAMLQYSQFVIGQQLKKDGGALLASCFAEWSREAKIGMHKMAHGGTMQELQRAMAHIMALESERLELQEQLTLSFLQIDQITETLQKELRGKEALVLELNKAYRTKTMSMSTTPGLMANFTPREQMLIREQIVDISSPVEHQVWSRKSSEETLDGEEPAPARAASARPAQPRSLLQVPSSPPTLVPPSIPQLPFVGARTRRPSRDVQEGMASAFGKASDEVKIASRTSSITGAKNPGSSAASQAEVADDRGDRYLDEGGYRSLSAFRRR